MKILNTTCNNNMHEECKLVKGRQVEDLVYEVKEHVTPYTYATLRQNKNVRLVPCVYKKGYYHMEMVKGYVFFKAVKPIRVIQLQLRRGSEWETVMVDDPMHWLGMKELAELAKPGRVLVAGLGMGLILHHLVKRKDISEIVVVEIDSDVISLIGKYYIPKDERIKIVNDDFFSFIRYNKDRNFDTVILDLWTISEDDDLVKRKTVLHSMVTAYRLCQVLYPHAKVLVWGMRSARTGKNYEL